MCDCVDRFKDQLIIYQINFLFINTLRSFTLCVFVSDMQHCDINTTLYRIGCDLIYSDKLLVMTVNYLFIY